jgi:phosphopantothenoylcysteine synthetase/decarboxylase
MIIVNSVQAPDSGFQGDNNTITILAKDGREISYPAMTKHDCANAILYSIGAMINL